MSASGETTGARGARKRRALAACTFCKLRKIKCNNEQPRCGNCRTYEKECIYAQGKSRPQGSRRTLTVAGQSPLVENAFDGALNSISPGPAASAPPSSSLSPSANAAAAKGPTRPNLSDDGLERGGVAATRGDARRTSKPDGSASSNYYGPTSAHFEEPALRSGRGAPGRAESALTAELVEKVLMAEAAHQRQMEAINFAAGELDFDGVDPELGLHLLSLHWNRQHHSFLLTYRPAFMRDMACGGKYFSKLLLNAIYYGASKFSPRRELRRDPQDVRTAGWTFRLRVKELLADALDRSEITTIQALLVMTNSLFALGDERSAAWLYAGLAFRMIIDLGLHVDCPYIPGAKRPSEEDVEIHRRVFWGAFVVDKIQSLYQGRPLSLQYIDMRVPLVFRDRYEELEHWTPFAFNAPSDFPGSPAYSVSTFTELCKLCILMNHIINKLYAEGSSKKASAQLRGDRESLQKQLEQWNQELPRHLVYASTDGSRVPPPHVLSLHCMFNVLLILLNRPFVSERNISSSNAHTVAAEAFSICVIAATKVVRLLLAYEKAFSIARAPYLISYATYVSATIHVRVAAQREPGSDAHNCLQICLSVLETNQETNWAVRKATKVIAELAERMNVDLAPRRLLIPPTGGETHISPAVYVTNQSLAPNGTAHTSAQQQQQQNRSDAPDTHPNEGTPSGLLPELDMEAIIQSFMQEQSDLANPVPQSIQNYSGTHADYLPGSAADLRLAADAWQGAESGATIFAGNLAPDDALFGFNRLGFDSGWWADNDWTGMQ